MENFVILIPSYNDWESLNVLIPKINNAVKNINKNISILIVNDSSTLKNNLVFKEKLCFKKIEILNLIKNIKAQKAIATALYHLKNKNYKGGIIVMDADGQDDPENLIKIIKYYEKNNGKIITVNRTKRNESLLFKVLYEIHLFLSFILTFQNLRFGVYSCMNQNNLKEILSNNDLCSAFAGALAKNFKNKGIIYSERKKRLLGESKNSYLNLIYYSLSILSVFKFRLSIHSIIILFLFYFISSFYFFLLLAPMIIFIFLIFYINFKNNKFDLKNCLNNVSNLENINL
tara:strand:- start:506 stop:1369 length:864 start_codon:yes stop_codon:yes gene_type:complete